MNMFSTASLRRILVFLLAIALSFSISTSAWADDSSKMSLCYPQEGDDMIYYWELEKNKHEVDFSDIPLYLRFDVEKEGVQHVIKAGWLPELAGEEKETACDFSTSFKQYLEGQSEYIANSDIYGIDPDELIEKSGLTVDEAENQWFTCIQVHSALTYPYRIEIFDNFQLYERDMILGAYGAQALSVEETELAGCEAVKISIDYTDLFKDSELDEEQWELLRPSLIKNYILIFDNSTEILLSVSGTTDMDTLVKIAENVEICETKLTRSDYNEEVNYILHDLARG